MEYERIHKVQLQMGVISPTKLRMKLLGVHNHRRKEGANASSRTSPSKLEEEYTKNSLLASGEDDSLKYTEGNSGLPTAVANVESQVTTLPRKGLPIVPNSDQNGTISMEENDMADVRTENTSEGVSNQDQLVNSRIMHAVRSLAEESNGYDSGHDNGSSSGFEFHKGERIIPSPVVGPFYRPVPSKWNDAEKWIINRQSMHPHPNVLRKTLMQQRHGNQRMSANLGKVAPESVTTDQGGSSIRAADTKMVDLHQPQTKGVKLPFASFSSHPVSEPEKRMVPAVKSVSMRDMGTEMTPVASLEPSRTGTPNGAMTPSRSPVSSKTSSPRRGTPAKSLYEATTDNTLDHQEYSSKIELSERERKLKTRKEILALGLQLGKTNIAAWASKDDVEDDLTSNKVVDTDQLQKLEFEARAAAWEEAEKTRHMARYKREEVKIQVWESHQKAKFEAQMKDVEAQADKMKMKAHENMLKQISLIKQCSEEKLAAAEARKKRCAARTEQQVERIRQTGHFPPHYLCCAWFS